MNRGRVLLLFTRSPEGEARAKGFSPAAGAALFQALLDSWTKAASRAGAQTVISTPSSCRPGLEEILAGSGAAFLTQSEKGFGERLAAAACSAYARGGGRTLLIAGGDSPAPDQADLETAFRALEEDESAAALGPSRDGGLYLIGLSRRDVALLRSIGLRKGAAFEQLKEQLASRRRAVTVLPRLSDIDELSDVQRVFPRPGVEASWAPFADLVSRVLAPGQAPPPAAPLPVPSPGTRALRPRAPPAAPSLRNAA